MAKFLINTVVDAEQVTSGEAWRMAGEVEELPEGFTDIQGYLVYIKTPQGTHPVWIPSDFFEAISSEVI
ncbi:hypothetical protein BS042_RS18980 [Vibrio parahaemolyticus]|uniref:hypothetical protein n=1 Tax=Vibrio parahaemolyticus TaxID=670 RepID=UPI0004108756|nr:hypothetical protein [Vibrio parahaemolyticus]EJG1908089.1 hypothetical protein [Vibrio parahaemolyticus]MCC4216099.1 hypothetical protein [Vibrio parahaemolyticus]HCM0721814.1 hypothetical protein [Vibrio parahaemolyticus]